MNTCEHFVSVGGCNSAVECLLPKQDVVGSNPITRSIDSKPDWSPADKVVFNFSDFLPL